MSYERTIIMGTFWNVYGREIFDVIREVKHTLRKTWISLIILESEVETTMKMLEMNKAVEPDDFCFF